jgi:acyl-CoA reductase-like NAD-dependent aldehyde dehydrogenase
MVKDGDSARKRAVEYMTLAAKTSVEERSDILRAIARSWMTLAMQLDRLEASKFPIKEGNRKSRSV